MDILSPSGWALLIASWLVAFGWLWRVSTALIGLSRMPNIAQGALVPRELSRNDERLLTVVVPARNEEQAIDATLRSLLAVEGVAIEIIAVDDRSTDSTGRIMDQISLESTLGRNVLRVHHVQQLPEGWMGKTHAMALAAQLTTTPWLLFTDADVIFRSDSLARALRFAERERADHVVLIPTLILHSVGERMMIAFFQVFSLWGVRPWRVADPKARRDFVGIGAFNLIRRSAYDAIGGYESLRMEVLEDARMGYEVKHRGFAQRVAFGPGLLRIRWAEGALGIIDNLSKNAFAAFRFRILPLLTGIAGIALLCLLPFVGLLVAPWAGRWVLLSNLLVLLSLLAIYRYFEPQSGSSFLYAFTSPFAACLLMYAVLRSVVLTLFRGGVEWRGTLYPLPELRKHCGPLW